MPQDKYALLKHLAQFDLSDETQRAACQAGLKELTPADNQFEMMNEWDLFQLVHLVEKEDPIWNAIDHKDTVEKLYKERGIPNPYPFCSPQAKVHSTLRKLYCNDIERVKQHMHDHMGAQIVSALSENQDSLSKIASDELYYLQACNTHLYEQFEIEKISERDNIDFWISLVTCVISFPISIVRAILSYSNQGHFRFWQTPIVAIYAKQAPIIDQARTLQVEQLTRVRQLQYDVSDPLYKEISEYNSDMWKQHQISGDASGLNRLLMEYQRHFIHISDRSMFASKEYPKFMKCLYEDLHVRQAWVDKARVLFERVQSENMKTLLSNCQELSPTTLTLAVGGSPIHTAKPAVQGAKLPETENQPTESSPLTFQ